MVYATLWINHGANSNYKDFYKREILMKIQPLTRDLKP